MRHTSIAVIIGLLWSISPHGCFAAGPFQARSAIHVRFHDLSANKDPEIHKEPQRWVAATLTLTLGTFGAHRLYLGTDVKVPLIYGITFGGFGVLALIDLGEILFTKDLAPYRSNGKVFMWSNGGKTPSTPP